MIQNYEQTILQFNANIECKMMKPGKLLAECCVIKTNDSCMENIAQIFVLRIINVSNFRDSKYKVSIKMEQVWKFKRWSEYTLNQGLIYNLA